MKKTKSIDRKSVNNGRVFYWTYCSKCGERVGGSQDPNAHITDYFCMCQFLKRKQQKQQLTLFK